MATSFLVITLALLVLGDAEPKKWDFTREFCEEFTGEKCELRGESTGKNLALYEEIGQNARTRAPVVTIVSNECHLPSVN